MTVAHWRLAAGRAAKQAGLRGARRPLSSGIARRGAEKSAAAPAEVKGVPYAQLKVGVPKETFAKERRVAISPAAAANLTKKGFQVLVEENAGALATFRNQDYEASGAKIVPRKDAFQSGGGQLLFVVRMFIIITISAPRHCAEAPPTFHGGGQAVPRGGHPLLLPLPQAERSPHRRAGQEAADGLRHGLRPQDLPGSGLRCPLLHEQHLGLPGGRGGLQPLWKILHRWRTNYMPTFIVTFVTLFKHFAVTFLGQITAAGKVPPAKVLVIGGGVAGLAAIGQAKNMGAIVR